ncbi:uncharacterized protein APUU_80502S [Aspergillus puulaauensis]|uniref:Ankyrin repeat-containing domain protein n=1 Tax=Aspergillus puulaauensis TaxID=1220207 RepID=A0A7R7XZ43_9EURO|nr:uncharacterized protein APUU_80502S [Aspergillus puulaauensis]BCS30199.1 hypothetical protein APUU_80502S [Aspergillus puulaauensis]
MWCKRQNTKLHAELTQVTPALGAWVTIIKEEKAIYGALNHFSYKQARRTHIAEAWCPTSSLHFYYLSPVSVLALAAAHGRDNIFQLLYADPTADKADIGVVRGPLIGGNLNIVRTVLDPLPGILPRYDEVYDTTAIIEVAQSRCSEELLRYMLSRKDIDVNHPCDGRDTVLRAAIRSGDMGKFRAVLVHPDLDINQLADYNMTGRGTVLDITLWDHEMGSPEKLPYLKALIARPGMNVNYPGYSYGSTAFGAAALENLTEVMQLLLERDDLDKVPINELDSALGNVEIVRRLLDPALGVTRELIQDAIDGTEAEMLDPFLGGDEYMERAQSVLEILRERIKAIDGFSLLCLYTILFPAYCIMYDR